MKANKLRLLRIKNKFSGMDMAKMVGISRSYYYQIEYGQKRLSYDLAIKIAKVFKKKPDAVFYDDFSWSSFLLDKNVTFSAIISVW